MKSILSRTISLVFGALAASATAASASEEIVLAGPGGDWTILGGVGYSWLRANELVYDDAGNRVSHLIWDTGAPVLTLAASARFAQSWRIMANAAFGFSGNSRMEDYDWDADFSPSFAFADWSHRSVHPDTRLHRYLDLSIAVGRDFAVGDAVTLNLHGGLKYTNVKWTAYGGSFVYSFDAFRDVAGAFPGGRRVISYEQRYPGVFIGAEAETRYGNWGFTGLVRGGLTIGANDIDHHWLRDLRFDGNFGVLPFVSLGARVDYRITDRAAVLVAGNFDRYFHKKGDMRLYDIQSGAAVGGPFRDGGGVDLSAVRLSAAFKLAF